MDKKKIAEVIRAACMNVKAGVADDRDMAIYMLLSDLKKLKDKMQECSTGKVPLHRQKPWYFD